MGELECDAWVAYYRRRWPRFLRAAFGLTRESFGLSWAAHAPAAVVGCLRANQVWAPYPDNDPDAARAYMLRFYPPGATAPARTSIPPRRLAWRSSGGAPTVSSNGMPARRRPGAGRRARCALLLRLRRAADEVRVAAEQRARAMIHSDRWVDEGCDPASALIAEERAALVRSYEALREAVSR